MKFLSYEEKMEWMCEVVHARRDIMSARKYYNNPILMFRKVFEICQGDYDVTQIKENYLEYYQILEELSQKELENEEKICENFRDFVKFFNNNQAKIRECDVDLYYVVLDLVFMLKDKGLYFEILYQDK